MMDLDSLSPWLVGVVKAPISCLAFPKSLNNGRLPKEYNIMQKERLDIGSERFGCKVFVGEKEVVDVGGALFKEEARVKAATEAVAELKRA
jgi:dsRNA-specific ribonuclease